MKNDTKKSVTKILVIAGVLLIIYLLFIFPLIKFNENESTLLKGAKRYFEINKNLLPEEGEIRTINGVELLDKKYIPDLRTAYNHDTCDTRHSFVKVKRKEGQYLYYTYLKCGIFSSNIDHTGPVITLNGNDTINVERYSKFKDPGVKSVIDNNDGKINAKDVAVSSDVDTSKNGVYTITYSAVDTLENKTEVTRTVKVTQNLSKTVEKATGKSNVYVGDGDNYIMFSGQLYRIVGLDSDGNTKIVANEDVGHIDFNSIKDYLNDFYDTLTNDSKKYVVINYNFCSDTVSSKDKDKIITCNSKKNTGNSGLLSINEYNSSLTKEGGSFLYPDTVNWTSNAQNDKKAWVTRNVFYGVEGNYYNYDRNYIFSIRPVLVIKKDTLVKKGTGSYRNPYIIDNFKELKGGTKINKLRAGEYISYRGQLYRVSSSTKDGVKVISYENFDASDINANKKYNPDKNNGNIGYFVDNNISKQVSVKLFKKHQINANTFEKYPTYNGKHTTKKYNVRVSIPSVFDFYSSVNKQTYYVEYSKKYKQYYGSENGTVFLPSEAILQASATKIAGYLRDDAVVVSGSGTLDDPYNVSY